MLISPANYELGRQIRSTTPNTKAKKRKYTDVTANLPEQKRYAG